MSVNIEFDFTITGFAAVEEADRVVRALDEIMRDESIHDQGVGFGRAELDGETVVTGETSWPLGISRAYLWRPQFEERVTAAARGVVPDAKAVVHWRYPDEDC